jgi:hypothetical protein
LNATLTLVAAGFSIVNDARPWPVFDTARTRASNSTSQRHAVVPSPRAHGRVEQPRPHGHAAACTAAHCPPNTSPTVHVATLQHRRRHTRRAHSKAQSHSHSATATEDVQPAGAAGQRARGAAWLASTSNICCDVNTHAAANACRAKRPRRGTCERQLAGRLKHQQVLLLERLPPPPRRRTRPKIFRGQRRKRVIFGRPHAPERIVLVHCLHSTRGPTSLSAVTQPAARRCPIACFTHVDAKHTSAAAHA